MSSCVRLCIIKCHLMWDYESQSVNFYEMMNHKVSSYVRLYNNKMSSYVPLNEPYITKENGIKFV